MRRVVGSAVCGCVGGVGMSEEVGTDCADTGGTDTGGSSMFDMWRKHGGRAASGWGHGAEVIAGRR